MSYMNNRIIKLEECMLELLAEFGVRSGRRVIEDACALMNHPQAYEWKTVKVGESEYQSKLHHLNACFCGDKYYEP